MNGCWWLLPFFLGGVAVEAAEAVGAEEDLAVEAEGAEGLADLAEARAEAAELPEVGKIVAIAFASKRRANEDGMLAREEKLTEMVRRLQEAAGENLQSVVLYGSAARGDYHAHKSDLNLLCVLKSVKTTELSRVASVIRWWSDQLHEPSATHFHAGRIDAFRRCFRH